MNEQACVEIIEIPLEHSETLSGIRRLMGENQGRLSAIRMLSSLENPPKDILCEMCNGLAEAECEAELLRQEIFLEHRVKEKKIRRWSIDINNSRLVFWCEEKA